MLRITVWNEYKHEREDVENQEECMKRSAEILQKKGFFSYNRK